MHYLKSQNRKKANKKEKIYSYFWVDTSNTAYIFLKLSLQKVEASGYFVLIQWKNSKKFNVYVSSISMAEIVFSLYTMAPIRSKINQCHFEASMLFGNIFKGITISRQIFKAWLRGKAKNNQCHGTVALVRMAPLSICKLRAESSANKFRKN